jgi:hypothetical protein
MPRNEPFQPLRMLKDTQLLQGPILDDAEHLIATISDLVVAGQILARLGLARCAPATRSGAACWHPVIVHP